MRRVVVAALAAAISLGLTSCGGEKPPPKAEFAKAKAQFVKQAEGVCRAAVKEFYAQARRANADKLSQREQGALGARLFRVSLDRELAALEDLKPPQALQSTFSSYRRSIAEQGEMQVALFKRQGSQNETLSATEKRKHDVLNATAKKLRRRLGLRSCL